MRPDPRRRRSRLSPESTPSRCGGPRIIIRANDSDAVARHLLTRTNAHDVTITSQNLEQAFLRLTGDDTEGE